MREEFEKLPEIAELLSSVEFCNGVNMYVAKNSNWVDEEDDALFINGAWCAYQTQQKRIDEALTWLTRTDIRSINNAREILQGGDA